MNFFYKIFVMEYYYSYLLIVRVVLGFFEVDIVDVW